MTNLELLQRRYRLGYVPFVPLMVALGLAAFLRHAPFPGSALRDAVVIAAVVIAVAAVQRWWARAYFNCPRCHTNLWHVRHDMLGSAESSCPHCGLRMSDKRQGRAD